MVWFKVDDKLHDHRKARQARKSAMGVWVLAGSWSADNLTDGFIPDDVATRWGTRHDFTALVSAGLWIEATSGSERGWQFVNWGEFQPVKADIERERAQKAEAGRKGGKASGRSRREAGAEAGASRLVEPPNPTRPNASNEALGAGKPPAAGKPRAKRATTLPSDFRPTEGHVNLASELGVDLRAEWPKFCDHHIAKGTTFKDWNAALRTWVRNAPKFSNVRHLPPAEDNSWMRRSL